jgi:hypothetical protein
MQFPIFGERSINQAETIQHEGERGQIMGQPIRRTRDPRLPHAMQVSHEGRDRLPLGERSVFFFLTDIDTAKQDPI